MQDRWLFVGQAIVLNSDVCLTVLVIEGDEVRFALTPPRTNAATVYATREAPAVVHFAGATTN